jgi:NADH-quinone oxidoreductase subunit H
MNPDSVWISLGNQTAQTLHLSPEAGPPTGVLLGALGTLGLIMIAAATMSWWLRKGMGWVQRRGVPHGGGLGLLQAPADALKLLSKEGVTPTLADQALFTAAPAAVFIAAYLVYVTLPFSPTLYVADLNVGVLYVLAVGSLAALGVALGAWASNNKDALLAAFRSAARVVGCKVPLAPALLCPVALAGTMSFLELVQGVNGQAGGQMLKSGGWAAAPQSLLDWFVFTLPVSLLCFLVAGLAGSHFSPSGAGEAEDGTAGGLLVEYSGAKLGLLLLAELASTLTLSIVTTLVFFGGWTAPLADPFFVRLLGGPGAAGATVWHLLWFWLKAGMLTTGVFHARAALPRLRADQVMDLGWKLLLPITLLNLLATGACVLLGVPRCLLAAGNWVALIALVGWGGRKGLPRAETGPGIGAAAPASGGLAP